MSSAPDRLDRLAEDLPTTAEDVEVLRRLRRRRIEGALREPNRLAPPAFLPAPRRRRRTFAGCPELEL